LRQPSPAKPPVRPWYSLAASAVVHGALLVLAVAVSRQAEAPDDRPREPTDERQTTQMVYLAPPEEPPPPPPQPPARPEPPPPPPPPAEATPPIRPAPPPTSQPRPEPEANAPPDATRSEGEDADVPEGGGTPGPAAEAAPTLESEARRIFGRPRLATRPGAGPQAVRPMEAYLPEDARCTPRPAAERDSSGGGQLGTVEGRIYRGDNGAPLAGAHLHMVGTPFTAFTDAKGDYRFRFDLSLVDNCRTQYVRVTAKGYESRMLVLVVGQSVRSEDVHLKKRGWF
jgi:hypothetical protein